MTTRIQGQGPSTNVALTQTARRVTPTPAQPFKNVLSSGADAVVRGAEAAVQRLPGGQLVAAAVRTPPQSSGDALSPTGQASGIDPMMSGGGPEAGAGDMAGVLAQQAENSLYYLQLQQQIQEETRAFSTISNVLKARHDTVKNAINNVR